MLDLLLCGGKKKYLQPDFKAELQRALEESSCSPKSSVSSLSSGCETPLTYTFDGYVFIVVIMCCLVFITVCVVIFVIIYTCLEKSY